MFPKFILIILILFVSVFSITISDALECSNCHTTDPGKASIKAKDTIEISDKTCLRCHNPDHPPTPMGYQTHLVHVGKYSVNTDYLNRHPKITGSLSCNSCHTQIIDCRSCHVKNIPHVKPPLGDNCKGCHKEIDKLFKHPTINLKIHDLFNLGGDNKTACTLCHNPDNMRSLKLASGELVSIEEPHKLCYQCHSIFYNLWDAGSHYANRTKPADRTLAMDPSLMERWENNWRKKNTCTNCHNPHNPAELYWVPVQVKIPGEKVAVPTGIIAISLIIIVALTGIYFIVIKKKIKILKRPVLRLPSLSRGELKAKFSISSIRKLSIRKLSLKNDIILVIAVLAMFGLFYVIFGTFTPMLSLVSESMSPHLEKGDMVFYEDISRIDTIQTYMSSRDGGHESFEGYGDVILFKPYGQDGVIPVIHRAMYFVNEGDEMWPDGPKAPHEGYITKGDNKVTNRNYDQQTTTSFQEPVKPEWILGVARYRIPYIGYIRFILP